MPNRPRIVFPADGEGVPVSNNPRVFIAHGRVVFDNTDPPAGLNGHLVTAGSALPAPVAVGSLISWSRGRRENVFHWALLFEVGALAAVPDGAYDLLVSTYTGNMTIKTAVENNSSSKSEGVVLVTSAGLALGVSAPPPNTAINGNMFTAYGSYTANNKPDRVTMTHVTTGAATTAGTVFANGNPNGYWYAAFSQLPAGPYVLDVSAGELTKTVSGLTV